MSKESFVDLVNGNEGLTEQFKAQSIELFENAVKTAMENRISEFCEKFTKSEVSEDDAIGQQLNKLVESRVEHICESTSTQAEQEVSDTVDQITEDLKSQYEEKFFKLEEQLETLKTDRDQSVAKYQQQIEDIKQIHSDKYNQLIEQLENADHVIDDLNQKLDHVEQTYDEDVQSQAKRLTESQLEDVKQCLEDYLDLSAKQYVEQHREQIANNAKVWLGESLINSITNTLEQFNITAPTGLSSLTNKVESVTEERDSAYKQLAESLDENIRLNSKIDQIERKLALSEACEGLTDCDKARMESLMEDDSCSLVQYKQRASILAENFKGSSNDHENSHVAVSPVNIVSESVVVAKEPIVEQHVDDQSVNPTVNLIANMFDRYNK